MHARLTPCCWVEKGVARDTMIASNTVTAEALQRRPLIGQTPGPFSFWLRKGGVCTAWRRTRAKRATTPSTIVMLAVVEY